MKTASRALRLLALLASFLGICGPAPAHGLDAGEPPPHSPQWRSFRSPESRFSVSVPSAPEVTTKTHPTIVGPVRETRYAAGFGETVVAIELHELPRIAVFLLPTGAILDRAREELVKATGGRVIASRDATHRGHSARELTYEIPQQPILKERALLVLVEHRLYIAFATWPEGSQAGPAAARVFESFEIWAP